MGDWRLMISEPGIVILRICSLAGGLPQMVKGRLCWFTLSETGSGVNREKLTGEHKQAECDYGESCVRRMDYAATSKKYTTA
jgi:hypothetical protein